MRGKGRTGGGGGKDTGARGFGFQNDWGEIGVSRYRLATLRRGDFSRVTRDSRVHTGQFDPHMSLAEEKNLGRSGSPVCFIMIHPTEKTRAYPFLSVQALSLFSVPYLLHTYLDVSNSFSSTRGSPYRRHVLQTRTRTLTRIVNRRRAMARPRARRLSLKRRSNPINF